MFLVVNGLIGLYLILRYVRNLNLGTASRFVLAIVLLGLIEHHWLVSRFFGTIASPEIPREAIMALGTAYGALILLACLLLLRDIAGLLLRPVAPRARATLFWNGLAHGMAAVSLALAAVGVSQAVRVPEVRTLEISLSDLAPEFDGYQIVHLTDLHASRLLQGPWVKAVVEKTNALAPSLIVISGDLVDGTPEARRNDYPPFGELKAPDGVYAVAGNHEYYAEYADWMTVFQQQGIIMLENEHVVIRKGEASLVLAGVPDRVAPGHGQSGPEIGAALDGKPDGVPVILLDHRPGNMRANAEAGVNFQLSGHTHGGHVRGLDLIVARFNDGFVSGLYQVGAAQLYVSNGAGLWPGFPLRIGRGSEITKIVLRAGGAK